MNLIVLALGVAFGFVLSRSGAADYNAIQGMFLFTDLQLYGILGVGVGVIMPGLWLLKRHGKTITGDALKVKSKPRHKGTIIGGVLFGIGWSITGMCPGPILVNLGEGKLYSIAALAGVLSGAYLIGVAYPKLIEPLGLPGLGPNKT